EGIQAGQHVSTITKEGVTMNVIHLSPEQVETRAVETPHYLKTLLNVKPLKREGMLTVTASTQGNPLVLANLLSTTNVSEITSKPGEGYVSGTVSGKNFVFSTRPGNSYRFGDIETDALAITWLDDRYFVAMATSFRNGTLLWSADKPVTFEYSEDGFKYYCSTACSMVMGFDKRPVSVALNGKAIKTFTYDQNGKTIRVAVPGGEGTIVIQ
ncbi:MAG: hypothetical protein ABIN89_12590, partial [Chitinophagaceae bacterium]